MPGASLCLFGAAHLDCPQILPCTQLRILLRTASCQDCYSMNRRQGQPRVTLAPRFQTVRVSSALRGLYRMLWQAGMHSKDQLQSPKQLEAILAIAGSYIMNFKGKDRQNTRTIALLNCPVQASMYHRISISSCMHSVIEDKNASRSAGHQAQLMIAVVLVEASSEDPCSLPGVAVSAQLVFARRAAFAAGLVCLWKAI